VDALRVWDEQEGRIDLLLTDLIMPGRMTGADLVNELRKRKPGLKVIISSGYADDLAGRDLNRGNMRFLPKPYEPHLVAQLVRKTLDARVILA
jgi:DNA-binding NtrC family response regulator